MQQAFWKTSAIILLMTSVASRQSLGAVARENRAKQNGENASGVQRRVITNASLPKNPTPNQESQYAPPAPSATAGNKAAHPRSAQQRLAEERAAEQWKRQILAP